MVQLQLPDGFIHPLSPAGRQAPHAAFCWLRDNAPLFFDRSSGMYYVTDHASVAQVLRDRRFSAALGQRDRGQLLPPLMLNADPPEHQRLRAPGRLLLGPNAVTGHLRQIGVETGQLLDGLVAGREAEAAADLAVPFATLALATVLRIPPDERAAFAALASRASVNLNPLARPAAARAGRRASGLLASYLEAITSREVAAGGSSPLADLARDGRLSRVELLGVLSLTVIGGFEPLAALVGNALAWLLWRPEAMDQLRSADVATAERAVDELLRLESPVPFVSRVSTEPVTLPTGQIPAGARVLAMLAAANRDPAVFDRPDDLVLDRAPSPQLAFGGGAHFCLAAPLVRGSAAVLLTGLLRRFPGLRPAPDERPVWADSLIPRRVLRLRMLLTDHG